MNVEEHELAEVPGPKKARKQFLLVIVEVLATLSEDLFNKLIDHVKQKRDEQQPPKPVASQTAD